MHLKFISIGFINVNYLSIYHTSYSHRLIKKFQILKIESGYNSHEKVKMLQIEKNIFKIFTSSKKKNLDLKLFITLFLSRKRERRMVPLKQRKMLK